MERARDLSAQAARGGAGSRKPLTGSSSSSRCRGGPVTLDVTEWDFSKADCRNICRTLIENSKPLLLIGSPIDSVGTGQPVRAVLRLAFICDLYGIQMYGSGYFLTHIRILLTVGNSQQWWIS